jgi:hypothetical protein
VALRDFIHVKVGTQTAYVVNQPVQFTEIIRQAENSDLSLVDYRVRCKANREYLIICKGGYSGSGASSWMANRIYNYTGSAYLSGDLTWFRETGCNSTSGLYGDGFTTFKPLVDSDVELRMTAQGSTGNAASVTCWMLVIDITGLRHYSGGYNATLPAIALNGTVDIEVDFAASGLSKSSDQVGACLAGHSHLVLASVYFNANTNGDNMEAKLWDFTAGAAVAAASVCRSYRRASLALTSASVQHTTNIIGVFKPSVDSQVGVRCTALTGTSPTAGLMSIAVVDFGADAEWLVAAIGTGHAITAAHGLPDSTPGELTAIAEHGDLSVSSGDIAGIGSDDQVLLLGLGVISSTGGSIVGKLQFCDTTDQLEVVPGIPTDSYMDASTLGVNNQNELLTGGVWVAPRFRAQEAATIIQFRPLYVTPASTATLTTQTTVLALKLGDSLPPGQPDPVVPTVDSFSPATGSTIAPADAVEFNVTDDGSAAIDRKVILASFASGLKEIVYDGSAFAANYNAASTIGVIADGFEFSIVRDTGWPGSFTLYFEIYDADGNLASPSSANWVVSGSIAPVVDEFDPVEDAQLATPAQPIIFDVTGPNSFAHLAILASIDLGDEVLEEVVYRDAAFVGEYGDSTATPISGGYTFSISRESGWQGDVTLRFDVRDSENNVATPSSASWTAPAATPPTLPQLSPSATEGGVPFRLRR